MSVMNREKHLDITNLRFVAAKLPFRFCTSDDHLSGRENQCCCLRVTNTHDNGCKTLKKCEQ